MTFMAGAKLHTTIVFLFLHPIFAVKVEESCGIKNGSHVACPKRFAQDHLLIQMRRGQGSCCGKCGGKGFCSPKSGNCYESKHRSYYQTCGEPVCCDKCGDTGYCSPSSGNCYSTKNKDYYQSCDSSVRPTDALPKPNGTDDVIAPTDCCGECNGKAYCSPKSGNCYWRKGRDYYKVCDATAVPPGALPKASSNENSIRFMSYNLFGWNAFNVNKWKRTNVLRKIKDWSPAVLGAQEVEMGGCCYEEVAAKVTDATALQHVGGSQFFDSNVLEKLETSWVDLVRGYWMSMTRFKHRKTGLEILFFNSHWKHGYGMEQAEIVAHAINEKRNKYGNPPTILVGDTNQFCKGYEKDAIKYLKGETGAAPVTFQDVHEHDYGKSFSDTNNPDCRVDFMLASVGQWSLVDSFIDREGMGASGSASDHAPLMGELVPIVDQQSLSF